MSLDHTDLVRLDGLSGLQSVGGSIWIDSNMLLSSVEGLSQLMTHGANVPEPELTITHNPMLPQCQVDELSQRFNLTPDPLGNDEQATCN